MILNVSWCLSYPKHPQTTRLKTTRLSPAKKSPDRSPAQADPRGRHPRCRCLSASETGKRCRDHAEGQNQRSNGQTVKPRTCGTNHPNPLQTSTHKRLYHGTSVLLQHAPVVTDFFSCNWDTLRSAACPQLSLLQRSCHWLIGISTCVAPSQRSIQVR